ncbi:RNA polymerase sigma factor [Streptomyces sp. NPDC012888]|uniref:RNA polymerase sigma factor n=1 Tax=Streptomyces sp. NPDC012888 TaxID=3364855 RepID=UPI0036761793
MKTARPMAPMPVSPSGHTAGEADAGGTVTSASSARFEDLFQTLRPKIAAYVRARFPALSWSDAEDVAAEALQYAYRNWERIGQLENLTGYVTRTAHHKAIDMLRSLRRVTLADEATLVALIDETARDQVSEQMRDSEVWGIVREAVAGLKRGSLRHVVSLQAAGASDAVIAEALGITTNQLHVQRSRAIKELRRQLAAYIRDGHARKHVKAESASQSSTTPRSVPKRLSATRSKSVKSSEAPKRKGRPGISPEEAADVMRKAGFEPLEPYPGSNAKWRCRCITCGKEVLPRYGTARKGHGCRYCAGQVVDPEAAATVMRERGLEPIGAYPGATKKWAYTCLTCGHEGATTYHSAKSQASGCIMCGRQQAGARQ